MHLKSKCKIQAVAYRTLRAWQGQALESMSLDLSRSMQPSPDFPQEGSQSPPLRRYPHSRMRGHHSQRGGSSPARHSLKTPTYLRNLASLATSLATPHWMQGTFPSPTHNHAKPSSPGRGFRATSHGQAQPTTDPTNTAGTDTVPRADSWGEAQQPLVPTNTLAAPGHAEAAPREGLAGCEGPEGQCAEPSGREGSEEEHMLLLSGSGVEEEVLKSELQALRAARQQLQQASMSQVAPHRLSADSSATKP